MNCCICGKELKDYKEAHSAEPYANGNCCEECMYKHVIPARLEVMTNYERSKKDDTLSESRQ